MGGSRRPARVLMALPDRRVRGGPPSHLYLLRDALRANGLDVRGFIYGGRTEGESAVRKVGQRSADLVRLAWRIVRDRPDLVHLNSAFDRKGLLRDVFFAPLCQALGARVVIKFHGSDAALASEGRFPWGWMTRRLLRSCDSVFLLSHEERRTFEREHPGCRYRVVKNVLDLSRYEGEHGFRQRYGVPPGRPLLLFIARFIESKGIFDVIRALPQIRQRHDVFAAFVGDGPVRAEAESLCAQVGVARHVVFTGYIPEDETIGAYRESDLLLFPTYHFEGMPMVVFHSLAAGLPIITTRIRAAADWLEDGRHCVFVPPRDVTSLVEAAVSLLDAPERRAAMVEAGRELVRALDGASVAKEFMALYDEVMGASHGDWQTGSLSCAGGEARSLAKSSSCID